MKELKVRLTFLEEVLGTANAEKDIHEKFIASKAPDAPSREQEVVGEFTYHTNYLYVDGKLRYGFVIDSMIGEKPKVLTVHFTLRHGSNIKQVTANTNLGTVTFKSSEIRKGQVKYVTTAANTMFWKLNTSFNAVMADGTTNPGANGQITPILTNKKG